MKTYIINLERSTDRKMYMNELLSKSQELDLEFIPGVDGRLMSEDEKAQKFDAIKYAKTTLQNVRPGEIGCTLSHQKCYRQLLRSNANSALIFEDDIVLNEPLDSLISNVERILDTEVPTLILLSGWFWFTSKKDFDTVHKLAKVHDGFLAHAYALNKAAAKKMIDERPWYIADDWEMIRKRGINVYGLIPHPVDQDWSGVFKTSISNDRIIRTGGSISVLLGFKYRGLCQRILKLIGKFEPAIHGK